MVPRFLSDDRLLAAGVRIVTGGLTKETNPDEGFIGLNS
jgi:hypothetical protein